MYQFLLNQYIKKVNLQKILLLIIKNYKQKIFIRKCRHILIILKSLICLKILLIFSNYLHLFYYKNNNKFLNNIYMIFLNLPKLENSNFLSIFMILINSKFLSKPPVINIKLSKFRSIFVIVELWSKKIKN